jgi:uncharacterized Zn-binding protein involved in type VI secretion
MLPAARKGDVFVCPAHGGGALEGPCRADVLIGNQPAARVGDGGPCGSSGAPDAIKRGNPLVLIGGAAAAGMSHEMAGGGIVATGCGNVFIGNPITDANGTLVPVPPECNFVWKLLEDPPNNLGRLRSTPESTAGPPVLYFFPGVPAPQLAATTIVTIRGHSVVVVAPGPGVPVNGQLPTVAQVTASLGALSDEQLSELKTVVLNPVSSPNDPYWQEKYKNPNHRSAAESGAGRTTFYPQTTAPPSARFDRMMQHEVAHLLWEKLGASDREGWQSAMDADRRAVTIYGNSSIAEDFAEAVLMYSLVRGTPCEAAMKAAFPQRFAALAKIFSQRGS